MLGLKEGDHVTHCSRGLSAGTCLLEQHLVQSGHFGLQLVCTVSLSTVSPPGERHEQR